MERFSLGIDIGGTHATAGVVDIFEKKLIDRSLFRRDIDSSGTPNTIIKNWSRLIRESISKTKDHNIAGIGIAMPGPFDYVNGISEILNVGKYESLFGLNIKYALASELKDIFQPEQIRFMNDAHCFLAGESWRDNSGQNVIGLTLGTGFGSAFFKNDKIVISGKGVPSGGFLFNQAFHEGRAEDFFNSNWFITRYFELSGKYLENVKMISQLAEHDKIALQVFEEFAFNLSEFLSKYIIDFDANEMVIGGNISRSSRLFINNLETELLKKHIKIKIKKSSLGERAALIGAGRLLDDEFYGNLTFLRNNNSLKLSYEDHESGTLQSTSWRKTEQFLAPVNQSPAPEGNYDIYPSFPIGPEKIKLGIKSIADEIIKHKNIIIDGYIGVYWDFLADQLFREFSGRDIKVSFFDIRSALKNEDAVNEMVQPFLGDAGSVFGRKAELELIDFFDRDKLDKISPDNDAEINILLGCGAALAGWEGMVIYADLPKNELQFRMRAGSITNLGSKFSDDTKLMYKRFYFVDWVVLNNHKRKLLPQINFLIDAQRPKALLLINADDAREALEKISQNYFRVRPWFEPGPWGGSWIKNNIKGLAENVPNYAWSFELIVPENGLMLESDGRLLELSFDFLMYQEYEAILGKAAKRFGVEFPIRFDFLDTFDGGNLSIQCHPRPEYIKNNFGESFTQDETYYILDTKDQAKVFLGFKEGIDAHQFREELQTSFEKSTGVNIENYVQSFNVNKHDLLLIPNGTIHGSGINNLVLEISSTPYIFTFKMFDWLRMDLDGMPRPINIDHAYNNLYFNRKGEYVKNNLLAKPEVIASGEDWKIVHLKTHPDHFYDVERIEFSSSINIHTENRCHVCNLVKGKSVFIETKNGMRKRFNYSETFVIPAAAGSYKLINESDTEAWVVKAFIKELE